jgi:hypothetical protein
MAIIEVDKFLSKDKNTKKANPTLIKRLQLLRALS